MVIVNHYPSSCGILGILRMGNSPKVKGADVVTALETVKFRGAGLGAGFAAVNLENGEYRMGVFMLNDKQDKVVEILESALRNIGVSRIEYRVKARLGKIIDVEYVVDGASEASVDEAVGLVNNTLWELGRIGRVYYWGRHVSVFKGVGHPSDVAKVYGVYGMEADSWVAHTRFPTNSPGYLPYWSHPFSVGDIAVVHNGELSSYGVNATQLSISFNARGLVGTDSEVVAYLLNYLVKVLGLGIEDAVRLLVNPSLRYVDDPWLTSLLNKYRWARLDGPFTVAVSMYHDGDVYLVAFADRFKLRPVVVGMDDGYLYVASEEAEIRAISPNARVWTLEPGGYFIASLKRGIVSWGRPREYVEEFFPHRTYPTYSGGDAIDARGLGYREINEEILRRIMNGAKVVRVINVNGQRFIGVNLPRYGIRGVRVEIYGTPGNALANLNNGVEFVVYGNVQDDVGDTMHGGKIVVHGDARDVLGQTFQGGRIYVLGNAGNRVGIQMREYYDKRPYMVIGGRVDDYLGEYMAGGVIVVLGLPLLRSGKSMNLTGNYVGSGMVGGRIYIRGRVDEAKVGLAPSKYEVKALVEALKEEGYPDDTIDEWARRVLQVSHVPRPIAEYRELTEDEARELKPILMDYAHEFGLDEQLVDDLIGDRYTVVKPGIKSMPPHLERPSE